MKPKKKKSERTEELRRRQNARKAASRRKSQLGFHKQLPKLRECPSNQTKRSKFQQIKISKGIAWRPQSVRTLSKVLRRGQDTNDSTTETTAQFTRTRSDQSDGVVVEAQSNTSSGEWDGSQRMEQGEDGRGIRPHQGPKLTLKHNS